MNAPPRKGPWTDAEMDLLRQRYPHDTCEAVAPQVGRSIRACYQMARQLGIGKSAEFLASNKARRLDGVRGGKSRFPKGHIAWNKGLKGLDIGGKATRFQPGRFPHNHHPIGHERIVDGGYLQRKIADTHNTRRDYVSVHHLIWREAGRDIPPGHCLIFINGDKTDIRLDNLLCITKQENMRRNSVHNLPPELAELVLLRGAINRKLNAREKAHGQ